MQLTINYQRRLDSSLVYILDKLPLSLKEDLMSFLESKKIHTVNEIRIHSGAYISLIVNQRNIKTDIFASADLIGQTVTFLCDGSVYAHLNTIREGYISIGKGIRAGICGRAVLEGGEITGIYDITSVNLRLPQKIDFAGSYIFDLLKKNRFGISVLIYSPPGVGKTTILRDLVSRLSQHTHIRHAVIDTREEITPFLEDNITSDVFLSYPKGLAIELATKSMTPQIIICDEITSLGEAQSICKSVNCGVNLIATTHAGSTEELEAKEIMKPLFSARVFDYAIGVTRNSLNKYEYKTDKLK